jgi:cell division septal protein FtsQ
MSRIVDFPETPSAGDKRSAGMPSERFRLKQKHAVGQRRRMWHRAKVLVRLALLPLLILLWVFFPSLPMWRFNASQAVVTGANTMVTPQDVQHYLKSFNGQSVLLMHPDEMARQFQQQHPLAFGVWFRRHVQGLTVHINTQQPWAQMVTCLPDTACQPWGVLTNRFSLITLDKLPPQALTASAVSAIDLKAAPADNAALPGLTMIDMPPDSNLLVRADAREQLALVLQQLQALDKLTLIKLDLTNPINLLARFKQFDVQLGQLDARLTTDRLPRLVHLVEPVLSGRHGHIDRIDLRWEKEVTFHRVGDVPAKNVVSAQ